MLSHTELLLENVCEYLSSSSCQSRHDLRKEDIVLLNQFLEEYSFDIFDHWLSARQLDAVVGENSSTCQSIDRLRQIFPRNSGARALLNRAVGLGMHEDEGLALAVKPNRKGGMRVEVV